MTGDLKSLPLRPCVGIALFNAGGEVFVGRRKDGQSGSEEMRNAWQMPQGGVDPGEDTLAAAKRELLEETGVSSVALLGESPGWLDYELPPELLGKVWKGRYRGQTQKWYAFRFTGPETEINIHTPAGRPPTRIQRMAVDSARGHATVDRNIQASGLRRGRTNLRRPCSSRWNCHAKVMIFGVYKISKSAITLAGKWRGRKR